MFFDLFIAAELHLLGILAFGHFEAKTHIARKISKSLFLLGIVAIISWFFGSPWGAVAAVVMMGIGLSVHVWWCRKHGIGILSAEPRDKYYSLRGWS